MLTLHPTAEGAEKQNFRGSEPVGQGPVEMGKAAQSSRGLTSPQILVGCLLQTTDGQPSPEGCSLGRMEQGLCGRGTSCMGGREVSCPSKAEIPTQPPENPIGQARPRRVPSSSFR